MYPAATELMNEKHILEIGWGHGGARGEKKREEEEGRSGAPGSAERTNGVWVSFFWGTFFSFLLEKLCFYFVFCFYGLPGRWSQ